MKNIYGEFGGQYVPESILKILVELDQVFEDAIKDLDFIKEYNDYLKNYVGRETPLYFAKNLTEYLGGGKIYLKREDLNHTGSHKINNALGQALLAKRMGKKKVIAETGAGQHGVAVATVAAMFNMECKVFMGKEDTERQALNVFKMEALGAEVVSVETGTQTLSDAVDEALKYWVENMDDTFYIIGSAVGPHPYPKMVKEFQSIISKETKKQILEREGRLPDYIIACIGGGSNSIGAFANFIDDKKVKLIGVEAAGYGVDTDKHAATLTKGSVGIIHGMKTYVLQDDKGEALPVYSISAGLDYPGVGPEHSYLKETGRADYVAITDDEAVDALFFLTKKEGIIPAIESSHALAHAYKVAKNTKKDEIIIVNLSGRGDKDISRMARLRGYEIEE
ncbi:tryptophan synthase subunit beta [Tissierella creatinini]|nr:tryptophan synthase subunit beta [Tissierella creatinini]TJX61009.1 tryptophan synthase subunit beta [Soehngenia saccharolytica]